MKTVVTSRNRPGLAFSELPRFSGLLRYLSLRDIYVRYKQTWLGFGWSIIRPLVNVIIFGALSWLVDRSANFTERFVVVSSGIVFWQLLSTVATDVSNSLTANAGILTKVYFPKIVLPVSTLLVALVDFSISFVLFLIIFFATGHSIGVNVLLFPVFVALGMLFTFGLGLAAATASVRYRDIKFILPFFLQILFYASPVFLGSDFVLSLNLPSWMKALYQLNPLVFIINGYKYAFFGAFDSFDATYAMTSLGITVLVLWGSVTYFARAERSFADYI
jgi:lipopolysaccharide transport system permease protein